MGSRQGGGQGCTSDRGLHSLLLLQLVVVQQPYFKFKLEATRHSVVQTWYPSQQWGIGGAVQWGGVCRKAAASPPTLWRVEVRRGTRCHCSATSKARTLTRWSQFGDATVLNVDHGNPTKNLYKRLLYTYSCRQADDAPYAERGLEPTGGSRDLKPSKKKKKRGGSGKRCEGPDLEGKGSGRGNKVHRCVCWGVETAQWVE